MPASWWNYILPLVGAPDRERPVAPRGRLRRSATGASLAVIIGLCACVGLPLFPAMEHLSYDLPFLFLPGEKPDEALIVLMDEQSYKNLSQDPRRGWDRSVHTQLLDIVFARGAKAVVFDVLFSEPSEDREIDAALARAMNQQNREVILAAKLVQSKIGNQVAMDVPVEPIEPFLSAASHGIVDLPFSTDLVLRQHYDDPNFRSMASRVVEVLGRAQNVPVRKRWIRYYGMDGAIDSISYDRILQPRDLSSTVFSNKIVFVGQGRLTTTEGSNAADLYRTPYTRWTSRLSTGVEIQATVFLNLWRRDWLEKFSMPVEIGLFILSGLFLGAVLSLVRPWVAVVLAVISTFALVAIASVLVSQVQRWFPWLIIGAVQIPVALAWSLVTSGWREPVRTDSQPSLGVRVPDHTLVRRIGRGGYGEVWLARDIIGTYHAVKLIYRSDFAGPAPFDREFRGIQKFTPISRSHAGFVHVLHVGKPDSDECFFYIMEIADDAATGQRIDPQSYSPRTLAREILSRGRIPLGECIDLGIDLAAALDHLHQHQLIHRDIKPSNIIFVNSVPKFADIGLVTDVAARTAGASKIGTDGYMAPEGPGSPAADVFSLGMVLYEASMGLDPQQFPELTTMLQSGPQATEVRELHNIILTACETDPEHRYRTASELRSALIQMRDCNKSKAEL